MCMCSSALGIPAMKPAMSPASAGPGGRFITHDLALARRVADRIVVVERIGGRGPPGRRSAWPGTACRGGRGRVLAGGAKVFKGSQ